MKKAQRLPRFIDAIKRHAPIIVPRLTPKRLANLALVWYEMKTRRVELKSHPIMAKVEAANLCNLRCLGCRSGDIIVSYPPGRMKPELFKKILDQLGDYLLEIVFYLWGEPTLNRDLPLLVKMAHQRNISASISTNLHFLDEKLGAKILDCGLDKMVVCVDGFSQQSYGSIRVRGDFERVKRNIENFARMKAERGSRHPLIEWQYILTDDTFPQVREAQEYAERINIDRFVVLQDWAGRLSDWKYFKNLPKYRKQLSAEQKSCFWLYTTAVIQWDGGVFPCCHVALNDTPDRKLGNIAETDFAKTWNNEQFIAARSFLREGKPLGDIICCQCQSPPVFSMRDEDRDKRVYE